MAKEKKKRFGSIGKVFLVLILIGLIVGGVLGYQYYQKIYAANVSMEGEELDIYIPTGADQAKVLEILDETNAIQNESTLAWLADEKNYRGNNIVPGKYTLKNGWSNNDLINHLRAGNGRLDIEVTFHNIRTLEQLAGKIGHQIEADSADLIAWLQHPDSVASFGFNTTTILAMFIPDTYRMSWDQTAPKFMRKMASEYKKYWNDERRQKASALGMTQSEVVTLASIVQAEQQKHASERPKIAGLYINRLNQGMLLQSDPTVIYGIGDFSITRVLNEHLQSPSPYNTYLNKGLPPGPINLPAKASIDAVLNYEKHDYIFMCAKPESGGLHNFAKTYNQHLVNARAYHNWLDQRGR